MQVTFNVDEVENSQATLNDGDGRTIIWPLDRLPANTKVDDKITFSIGEDTLPKNILNEILEEN
jgi:hypothetical protein